MTAGSCKRINIVSFFDRVELRFESLTVGINWAKRHLALKTLRQVAKNNYFVDKTEIETAYAAYLIDVEHRHESKKIQISTINRKNRNTQVGIS